jgi:hypothetical protein
VSIPTWFDKRVLCISFIRRSKIFDTCLETMKRPYEQQSLTKALFL